MPVLCKHNNGFTCMSSTDYLGKNSPFRSHRRKECRYLFPGHRLYEYDRPNTSTSDCFSYSNHVFGSEFIRIVSKNSLSCSLNRQPAVAGGFGGDATRPQSGFPRCPVASMQVKERLPAGRRPNPHILYCTRLLPPAYTQVSKGIPANLFN